MRHLALFVTLLVGCGDDSTTASPDASIPPLPGDFSCVGKPRVATAPDPITFAGRVINLSGNPVDGITVEIHQVSDDALLGQGATHTTGTDSGIYSVMVPTAGVAPAVYRKFTGTNVQDTYLIDAFPLFFTPVVGTTQIGMTNQSDVDYQQFGITRDPTRSEVFVQVLDCPTPTGTTAPVVGATLAAPPGSTIIYDNALGKLDRAATATGKSGEALILNAPVGTFEAPVTAGPYTYRSSPMVGRVGAFIYAPVAP